MKRILICEDEIDTQESIKNILSKRDYEVFTASDGKESIKRAREISPDLILLDIRMPKIDGIEVAKQLRQFNAVAKIIFLTAFESSQLVKEAAKYDIFDYITKPCLPEQIINYIQEALT